MTKDFYHYKLKRIDGTEEEMELYRKKVILIVNVASECGFTKQYEGLENLYQNNKDSGFTIFGIPCNQFGAQEPGTNEEILNFCESRFNVSFPLFEKIEVNGDSAHPLYTFLKEKAPGLMNTKAIKWNFTKFLVDQNGDVLRRYAPQDRPSSIQKDLDEIFS